MTRPSARRTAKTLLLAAALAHGGCTVNPAILNDDTSRRVRTIELEDPPRSDAAPPPAPVIETDAATAAPLTPPKLEEPKPAVALPEAKVAPAPGRAELALTDVRVAALRNNLDIEVEQVRPAIARETRLEAEARFQATGFARYERAAIDQPSVGNARPGNRLRSDDAELGISLPLRTGGTATVSVPLTRSDPRIDGIDEVFDSAAAFSITQPLLRGAGVAVNTAPIAIARLGERQQDSRTKLAILNVLANAERSYWDLYAAARGAAVRLEQYERARTQSRQAIRLAEEGVVPSIEVTRARAGVARRVEDIITAENQRRLTERELKRVMNEAGMPVDSGTVLVATTDPDPRELVLDAPRALETAYANRMELLDLELQLAIDQLGVDVARNAKLPALAVDYSFKYLGADTSLSGALDQIGDTRHNGHSVGLTLEVPIGNDARKANFRRAVLQRALTETTTAQQRQFIERQVLDAIDITRTAWQRILAAREETLLAATNYQAEQRQFLAGARTSTDVLIAADFLAEAQLREVRALGAYEVSKVDLAFVTGTLLGSGTVELEPYGSPRASETTASAGARVAAKLAALGVEPADVRDAPATEAPVAPAAPEGSKAAEAAPTSEARNDAPAAEDADADEKAEADADATLGPTTERDTLWSLAREAPRPAGISTADMRAALLRKNPQAFVEGDPERLRRGVRLRLPSGADFAAAGGD